MNLNQIRLGPRLAIAFIALVLLGIANAALGWWRLETAHQDFADMQLGQARAAQALEWEGLTRLNVNRTLVIARSNASKEVLAHFDPQIKETSARISQLQKQLEAQSSQKEREVLFAQLAQLRKVYLKTRDSVFEMMKLKDANLMQALDLELVPAATAYLDQIAKLRAFEQFMANEQVQAKNESIENAQMGMLLMSALAIALGLFGSWVVTRSVTVPLQRAAAAAASIAKGELSGSLRADGRDEVAQLLGGLAQMQKALSGVVSEVRDTTDSIRTASGEVAEGSLDLSSRTETAAANLQQTAAAIEEISASAQQNAESARSANALVVNAREAAQRGGQVVDRVVQTMSQISTRSQKIADITGVIDGIAFQTNILALNAAVEAARAGEHGRGFAVVASEVRALASRSAGAAKEINSLIGDNVDAVDAGSALVVQAGSQMIEICGSIDRVADMVEQIARASSEQSQSVSQVNEAVTQLDQMTQQNAALVEQSAAAASGLRDQAARLVEVVSIFRIAERDSGCTA